jgi:hypothetical protein
LKERAPLVMPASPVKLGAIRRGSWRKIRQQHINSKSRKIVVSLRPRHTSQIAPRNVVDPAPEGHALKPSIDRRRRRRGSMGRRRLRRILRYCARGGSGERDRECHPTDSRPTLPRRTRCGLRNLLDLLRTAHDQVSGGPFRAEVIVDQVGTMMAAGFETTAAWRAKERASRPNFSEIILGAKSAVSARRPDLAEANLNGRDLRGRTLVKRTCNKSSFAGRSFAEQTFRTQTSAKRSWLRPTWRMQSLAVALFMVRLFGMSGST